MKAPFLQQHSMTSLLGEQTHIDAHKKKSAGRVLTATLVLTSLVDAFSILVIYLLINTNSATETLDVSKTMNLPKADKTQILDSAVVVLVKGHKYIINDKSYKQSQLVDALQKAQKDSTRKGKLLIQANENVEFDRLNPIFVAGAHTGYSTIKFAVWPQDQASHKSQKSNVAFRSGGHQ